MKALIEYLKPVAYILTLLILFQSCAVYKRQNATLEQAIETRNYVKVTNRNNQVEKYVYIKEVDDQYYGVKEVDGKLVETVLDPNKILRIQLVNRTATTAVNVGAGIGVLGIVFGVVLFAGIAAIAW